MRVLVAEDSRYYRKILSTIIKGWGYQTTLVEDGGQAWEILQTDDSPQLVILDWVMPKMSGLEVCRQIRNGELRPYRYIILLTSMEGQENMLAGLEAGADDYITKPFNELELKYRLKIGQRIIELENRITLLAMTDPLTGLLNRRAFFKRLDAEIQRSWRCEIPLSMIMLDIDDFKKVNDEYGHQVGDAVLSNIAAKLKRLVRKYDVIGRYGGEEFIICLPGVEFAAAQRVAERLRRRIEKDAIVINKRDISVRVTASLGLASLYNPQEDDVDYLVKKADDAVYMAKAQGKNRVYAL